MNESLYRDLIAAGVSSDEAHRIASRHPEASVDADELFKSLEEIRGMRPGDEVLEDFDNTTEITEDALSKAIADKEDQLSQMQAASDMIVDHVLSAIEDRKGAQLALAERQDLLAQGVNDMGDALIKSLNQQREIMSLLSNLTGQPMRAPKAVTGERTAVPAPGDTLLKGGAVSGDAVLKKALDEMEIISREPMPTVQNSARMQQLHGAVSAIEAGGSPELVAERYKIKLGA